MTGVKFAICGHLLALEDFCELLPVPDYSIFQFPCSYFVGSTSGDLPISGTCEPLLGSSRCASKIPCASFHCVGDAGLTGLWRAWDCCLGVKKVRGKNEALTIFHRIHVSFTYMYHINRPNVGKYYTLPMGSYGWLQTHHENGSPFYSLTSWTNRPCVKVNAEGPAQVGSWPEQIQQGRVAQDEWGLLWNLYFVETISRQRLVGTITSCLYFGAFCVGIPFILHVWGRKWWKITSRETLVFCWICTPMEIYRYFWGDNYTRNTYW